MGKTKPVEINSHFAWIPDNPINLVFAHMFDVGSHVPSITERTLLDWANQASIGNSIAFVYPQEDDVDPETLATVLAEVRQRATAMGNVRFEMLKDGPCRAAVKSAVALWAGDGTSYRLREFSTWWPGWNRR